MRNLFQNHLFHLMTGHGYIERNTIIKKYIEISHKKSKYDSHDLFTYQGKKTFITFLDNLLSFPLSILNLTC